MASGRAERLGVPPGLAATALPHWLGEQHRRLPVGASVVVEVPARLGIGGQTTAGLSLAELLHGAGFVEVGIRARRAAQLVSAARDRTVADTVGPGLAALLVSLNPSLYAADAGVGFARPGNRFWPAMLGAGIATVDRDQLHLLAHHRVGMTELAKRATRRADEVTVDEYRAGMQRLDRLVRWLQPERVCVIGLDGWRKGTGQRTVAGWQAPASWIGERPTYVMPNPSGLNAHTNVADLTDHLRRAITYAAPDGRAPRT